MVHRLLSTPASLSIRHCRPLAKASLARHCSCTVISPRWKHTHIKQMGFQKVWENCRKITLKSRNYCAYFYSVFVAALYVRMMKDCTYLMKQWAAVSTQFLWISVAPQMWKNVGSGRLSGQTWNKHAGTLEIFVYWSLKTINTIASSRFRVYIHAVSQLINMTYRKEEIWYDTMSKQ